MRIRSSYLLRDGCSAVPSNDSEDAAEDGQAAAPESPAAAGGSGLSYGDALALRYTAPAGPGVPLPAADWGRLQPDSALADPAGNWLEDGRLRDSSTSRLLWRPGAYNSNALP